MVSLRLDDGTVQMIHTAPLYQVGFFVKELSTPSSSDIVDLSAKLPATDPAALDALLYFLYFGQVPKLDDKKPTSYEGATIELLVKVYILAYKLDIEILQNKIIDELRAYALKNYFHLPCLQIMSRSKLDQSDLLRYLIAQLAYDVKNCDLKYIPGLDDWTCAGGSGVQKVFRLLCGNQMQDPAKGKRCEWHVHRSRVVRKLVIRRWRALTQRAVVKAMRQYDHHCDAR